MREIRTSGLTRGKEVVFGPPLLYSTIRLSIFGPVLTRNSEIFAVAQWPVHPRFSVSIDFAR